MSTPDQTSTGVSDPTYNLVSSLYHALKAGQELDGYIKDAQEAGDQDLVQYFQQIQNGYRRASDGAKQLLVARIEHEH